MKISKLFHWLYAILMLLPFAFFVPSVLYYAFNDNATMQTVEVPKTETISVDFNQLVQNGNFETNTDDWTLWRITENRTLNQVEFYQTTADYGVVFQDINAEDNHILILKCYYECTNMHIYYGNLRVNQYTLDSSGFVSFRFSTTGNRIGFYAYNSPMVVNNIQIFDLTKMFGVGNEPTIEDFNNYFPNSYYPYNESELMQITYDTGETEQLVQNTDIVNYAWESIWNLPLFSWCKVSFVATPFTFITGLFGLAPSNSFNYVFTYFASMSIIWLVFDVVLYVPLLVHRWLDKGIVE